MRELKVLLRLRLLQFRIQTRWLAAGGVNVNEGTVEEIVEEEVVVEEVVLNLEQLSKGSVTCFACCCQPSDYSSESSYCCSRVSYRVFSRMYYSSRITTNQR